MIFSLALTYIDSIAAAVVRSDLIPRPLRDSLLRLQGFDIERCTISSGVFIGSRLVSIRENVLINRDVFLDGAGAVLIGASTRVGMRSMIITGTHQVGGPLSRAGADTSLAVEIGPGCWLGAGVIVLPGVKIGPGVIVGAGSVVISDCASNSIYAGVPARQIRSL